jgi:hypothetical protein
MPINVINHLTQGSLSFNRTGIIPSPKPEFQRRRHLHAILFRVIFALNLNPSSRWQKQFPEMLRASILWL